ncbi:MAG: hypothetical protein WCK18_19630 [Prolixibacteraceae bacterium]
MKQVRIIFVFIAFLVSISWSSQSQNPKSIQTSISEESFKIISEEDHVDPKFGYNKCNLLIELKSRKTKEELTIIANNLRKTRKNYDKLWIGYYVFGVKDRTIAWATSNFTPNLEVEIIGASDMEIKSMNSVNVSSGKIGKWFDNRTGAECGMILFRKDNKIYMKSTNKHGNLGDDEFICKSEKSKIVYQPKVNKHKEYYIIEKNGNLGMYDESGKFGEAIRIP